jgi:hypothetical protein
MRKMKKFSDGGSDKYKAKYERKIADIKSDYDKAMKGKTGRAAEIAAAKRDQRLADAKDDLAKWTKSDRTETRAGEKAAERNLSMTRKYGAMKSAVKADDVAKVGPMDDLLKSAPKPQMMSKPEAKSRPAPTRRAPAKDTRQSATAVKQETSATPTPKPLPPQQGRINFGMRNPAKPSPKLSAGQAEYNARVARLREDQAQRARWSDVEAKGAKDAKLYRLRAAAEAPGASQLVKDRYRMAKETGMYASGGTVKKKPMPPQPTPAERAASKRQDESLKKAKPTPADVSAIGRGNRSSGMKAGGKAKMADKAGRALKKKSADTMGRAMMKKAGGGKCYAKGGSVSARADGCATKGKTKGKMV